MKLDLTTILFKAIILTWYILIPVFSIANVGAWRKWEVNKTIVKFIGLRLCVGFKQWNLQNN
jgi:hypothetical protein